METRALKSRPTESMAPTPARGPTLRRKCACGGTPGPGGECEECRNKRLSLQRHARNADSVTLFGRAFFEPRLGHNFSAIRVLTDGQVAESRETGSRRSHSEPLNLARSATKPMFKIEAGAKPCYNPQAIEAGLRSPGPTAGYEHSRLHGIPAGKLLQRQKVSHAIPCPRRGSLKYRRSSLTDMITPATQVTNRWKFQTVCIGFGKN
jgi:hypothetical protein